MNYLIKANDSLSLEKCDTGEITSVYSSFDEMCNFFSDNEAFRYNDKLVEATSTKKVVINDACQSIKIPLNNCDILNIKYSKGKSAYIALNRSGKEYCPEIFTEDWIGSIKTDRLYLPLKSDFQNDSSLVTDFIITPELTLNDCQKLLLVYSFVINNDLKTLVLRDLVFCGVPCAVKIDFSDNGFFKELSIYPYFSRKSSIFPEIKNAEITKGKMLSAFGPPTKYTSDDLDFSMVYDFSYTRMSNAISYSPENREVDWSGIKFSFI
jgi:hypothetical protein